MKESLLEIFKRRTRHPLRPRTSDMVELVFGNFKAYFPPGGSLILGESIFMDYRVFIVGQEKPKPTSFRKVEDLKKLNYGMLTPDDHSKILSTLKYIRSQPDKDRCFIVSFVDTFGADISMYSAEHFQAYFISHLIWEYLTIPVKTISIVLGEGGSGGALAIQVADRRAQVEDAMYATAPPESMASIIFRDATKIEEALAILRPMAKDLKKLRVIDYIIPAPKDVTDKKTLAQNIKTYIEKSIKDLNKVRIQRLVKRRLSLAENFGVPPKKGRLLGLRQFMEKPISRFFHKPPDLKVIHASSIINVSDDYGDGHIIDPNKEYVKCGEEKGHAKNGEGCGRLIPLEEYLKNHQVCPHCGRSHVLGAAGWIDLLADPGSFHELNRNLSAEELLDETVLTPSYKEFLEKQKKRTPFKESLVTAEAKIYGIPTAMAICEFYFSGGSMGVVFGEKFKMVVEYAIKKRIPLVSVCCSGGARLYEGITALMQMVKTIAAVYKLKKHGLLYISILGDPSTGGAIASYASLGDIIIAEPNAMVIFAGPRVMKSRGFEVKEDLIRAKHLVKLSKNIYQRLDYYHQIRGIHEIAPRSEMKQTVAKYLELYYKNRSLPR